MIIKNVELNNFCSIINKKFTFRPGINVISGTNGIGKSNVLKAIAFSLINYYPKKIEKFCNWNSNSFSVKLEMEHLNKNFLIEGYYNRKENKLTRKLTINNQEYYENSECVVKLEEFFNPVLCKNSILSMQGNLEIISGKPAERQEYLKKIYDLEFKEQIRKLEEEIEFIKNNELKELENEILVLDNTDYPLHELYELMPIEEIDNIRNQLKKFLDTKTDIENKIKQFDNFLCQKKIYEKSISDLKNEIMEIEKDNLSLITIKENIIKEIDKDFEVKKRQLEKELEQDFFPGKEEIEKELDSIVLKRIPIFDDSILEVARKEWLDISHNLSTLIDKKRLLEEGKCPTCGKDYTVDDLNELNNEIELGKEKLEIKIKRLKEVEKEKEDNIELRHILDKIIERQESLQYKLNKLIEHGEYKRNSIQKELDNEIKNIKTEKENLQLRKTNTDDKIDANNKIIKIKNDSLKSVGNSLAEIEKDIPEKIPSVPITLLENIEKIEVIINEYNLKVAKNKWFVEENEKTEKLKEENKLKKEKLIKQKNELDKTIENYKVCKTTLQKDFPNYVITRLITILKKGMNRFIENIYNKYLINIVDTKTGINIIYGDHEEEVNLASGFEKELFNLAYRNALAEIANLDVLFLDEIDSNANEENSIKVYRELGEFSNHYKQMFVISHKPIVKDILVNDYCASFTEIN